MTDYTGKNGPRFLQGFEKQCFLSTHEIEQIYVPGQYELASFLSDAGSDIC